jgi:hypothetical protein
MFIKILSDSPILRLRPCWGEGEVDIAHPSPLVQNVRWLVLQTYYGIRTEVFCLGLLFSYSIKIAWPLSRLELIDPQVREVFKYIWIVRPYPYQFELVVPLVGASNLIREMQQVPVIGAIHHKVICHQIPKHNTQNMRWKIRLFCLMQSEWLRMFNH